MHTGPRTCQRPALARLPSPRASSAAQPRPRSPGSPPPHPAASCPLRLRAAEASERPRSLAEGAAPGRGPSAAPSHRPPGPAPPPRPHSPAQPPREAQGAVARPLADRQKLRGVAGCSAGRTLRAEQPARRRRRRRGAFGAASACRARSAAGEGRERSRAPEPLGSVRRTGLRGVIKTKWTRQGRPYRR